MTDMTERNSHRTKKFVAGIVVGALSGFLSMRLGLGLIGKERLAEMDGSTLFAMAAALIYVLMGAVTALGTMMPDAGAKFLNVEDADELRETSGQLWPSAIALAIMGVALGCVALSGPVGLVAPKAAILVVLLAIVPIGLLSRQSVRRSDELMRAVMREAAVAAYYLTMVAIGGWALVAHLGFVAAPAMLDIVTIFFAATLVGSFVVIGKRGMIR